MRVLCSGWRLFLTRVPFVFIVPHLFSGMVVSVKQFQQDSPKQELSKKSGNKFDHLVLGPAAVKACLTVYSGEETMPRSDVILIEPICEQESGFCISNSRLKELNQKDVHHYIFTDSDIAVVNDLGQMFLDHPDFHLALTFQNSKQQPVNSGFIAVRGLMMELQGFLWKVLGVYTSKYVSASRMLGDQLALAWVVASEPSFDAKRYARPEPFVQVIASASVLFLLCAVYNWTRPEGARQFHPHASGYQGIA